MQEIFRRGAAKELRDKLRRDSADAAAENGAGITQQPASGIFIFKGIN
jgi:hypothetical protein